MEFCEKLYETWKKCRRQTFYFLAMLERKVLLRGTIEKVFFSDEAH